MSTATVVSPTIHPDANAIPLERARCVPNMSTIAMIGMGPTAEGNNSPIVCHMVPPLVPPIRAAGGLPMCARHANAARRDGRELMCAIRRWNGMKVSVIPETVTEIRIVDVRARSTGACGSL